MWGALPGPRATAWKAACA